MIRMRHVSVICIRGMKDTVLLQLLTEASPEYSTSEVPMHPALFPATRQHTSVMFQPFLLHNKENNSIMTATDIMDAAVDTAPHHRAIVQSPSQPQTTDMRHKSIPLQSYFDSSMFQFPECFECCVLAFPFLTPPPFFEGMAVPC